MATVHLIEGPVGAGKSTYGLRLAREHRTVLLNLDYWMARLFSPDRPDGEIWDWYRTRKARCLEQIWELTRDLLQHQEHAVLELGLLQSAARVEFFQRVEEAGFRFRLHVLEVPSDERWQRVQRRNREQGETYAMHVSEEVFALASGLWESPTEAEGTLYEIIRKGAE